MIKIPEIKFELLIDHARIDEFAAVAWLAQGEGSGLAPTPKFLAEIKRYIDNANSPDPKITRASGLAFVLTDEDKIIGTILADEDRHFDNAAQLNDLAVVPEYRGRFLGRKLLRHAFVAVKKYSDYEYVVGSTVLSGAYYEALKIPHVGTLEIDGCKRRFYGAKID
ncbi:MAG: GNAT family N-acetyltransferase [Alphaproteobacteria bacterium]|nr:GNAT family N-acetyltransferase [Alphaproteobacteria bacterium]